MDFLWKRRKKKWKLNQWNIAWLSLYKITVEIWDNWHLAQLTPWINIYFCLKLIIYRKYRVIQFQFRHWKTVLMSVLVITNEVTSRPSHTCSYSHNEFVMVMSSNEFECRSSSTWTTFSFIKSMSSEKNETIFQINCYRRLKFYIVFETNQNFRVWKAVNPIFFYLVGTRYGFSKTIFPICFQFQDIDFCFMRLMLILSTRKLCQLFHKWNKFYLWFMNNWSNRFNIYCDINGYAIKAPVLMIFF